MPLCRPPLIRSLLHSCALHLCRYPRLHRSPCPHNRAGPRYSSSAPQAHRQLDSNLAGKLDLSKVSADSAYLDFILGPGQDSSAFSNDVSQRSHSSESIVKSRVQRRSSETRKVNRRPVASTKGRIPVGKSIQRNRPESRAGLGPVPIARSRLSRAAWRANLEFHRLRAQGVRLQSKFVSVGSGALSRDHSSRNWNANFARIQAVFDGTTTGVPKDDVRSLNLHPETNEWVTQILEHLQHNQKPDQVPQLLHKDPKQALLRWQNVALWLLSNDPQRMIDLLKATNTGLQPPLSCLEDSLQYLAKHFSQVNNPGSIENLRNLGDVFIEIANRRPDTRLWITSSFFRLLMRHGHDQQVQLLYRTIKLRHVRVSWHTHLHFATYFARHDHFEQSLDAILEARNAGAALDSYAFRSNCATLLRTAIRQPGGLRVTMRIVSNLVKIGLPLNTRLCNIVMLNAVEAGDLKTAFSVYHSLVEHGLQADVYTHSILLKGCKRNAADAETLNAAIRNAIDGAEVLRNVVLATDILHCLALHHTKQDPTRAYDTVFDAYAELFDLEPLQKLGLPLSRPSQFSKSAETKLRPNQYALNIMLATYLDHHFALRRSTQPIHELYQRFRNLVESGEEPFNLMAESDHTANIFLSSFTRTKKGLLYAAEVIKDMQRPLHDSANIQQCAPTVHSWSIFLHGFTRHKQLALAEQVLHFMRVQGLQPNHVTWTSLIAGYAGAQDLDRTLDAVRRGEADGAVWDEWTVSGLRRLIDQQKLQDEYRKRRLATSLDFTQELRSGLGARLNTASTDVQAEVGVAQDGERKTTEDERRERVY